MGLNYNNLESATLNRLSENRIIFTATEFYNRLPCVKTKIMAVFRPLCACAGESSRMRIRGTGHY